MGLKNGEIRLTFQRKKIYLNETQDIFLTQITYVWYNVIRYGKVSEWLKEAVLKTVEPLKLRGFESHPFRQRQLLGSRDNREPIFFSLFSFWGLFLGLFFCNRGVYWNYFIVFCWDVYFYSLRLHSIINNII